MQNLGQLSDWETLEKGQHIVVPATAAQWVTISVNAAAPVALYYWPLRPDGTFDRKDFPSLLARVVGLDELRFATTKGLVIEVDGDCAVRTNAGLERKPVVAGESFTRMVERRPVSPEVAAVVARANANQRKLQRQMQQILDNQQRLFMQASKPKEQKPNDVVSGKGAPVDAAKAGKQKPASEQQPPAGKAAAGGEGDGAGAGNS